MRELFIKYGFNFSENIVEMFKKYYELLIYFNEKFNITAITEEKEVYIKHFVDSILPTNIFKKGMLIDIGSGGGFPAIPLKIINKDLEVTMLEATGKKCEFLKTVISELNLKNIKVINGRAEDLAKDQKYRENFDFCTARAVARLNTLSEYCLPFVKIGGRFIAYKSNSEDEIKEAKNAIKILGGELESVKNYNLEDANRSIITILKKNHTEKKYPRGNGKERKSPL